MQAGWTLTVTKRGGLGEEESRILWEAGATGIWEVTPREWRVSFPGPVPSLSGDLEGMGTGISADWREEPGVDWAARYQETLRPFPAGDRLAVLPSRDLANPWPHRLAIRLAPGMAFGTGEHFTTASCIRLLERVRPAPDSVADVGCGSGILSVAACLLGARRVCACDVDEDALRVAEENAALNGVTFERLAGGPDRLGGPFRCVLANIQAEVLVDLMPELRRITGAGGQLVLAGILCERAEAPLLAAQDLRFRLAEVRTDGRWTSFRMVG